MRYPAALVLVVVLCLFAPGRGLARNTQVSPLFLALIGQAAGRVGDTLEAVAASTRALAATYRDLLRTTPNATPDQRSRWLRDFAVKDDTVAFRSPDCPKGPAPAAQAPCPAYLHYDGERFSDETFRQLDAMTRLAPALAAAHGAFPFSWVYLTTPDQNFCIYPFLPLDEAVANDKPTDKGFYKAADFEHKACGWESPYLDLAGAGMMVTVSCPVYEGETLLGVLSRDITLEQLSSRILADLAAIPGARAVVVNKRGKAIAASDAAEAQFISEQNAKAGEAVVYCRADRGLAALGLEKGVTTPDDTLDLAVEAVIERANKDHVWPQAFSQGGDTVLAARIEPTGWYLVLLVPDKAGR